MVRKACQRSLIYIHKILLVWAQCLVRTLAPGLTTYPKTQGLLFLFYLIFYFSWRRFGQNGRRLYHQCMRKKHTITPPSPSCCTKLVVFSNGTVVVATRNSLAENCRIPFWLLLSWERSTRRTSPIVSCTRTTFFQRQNWRRKKTYDIKAVFCIVQLFSFGLKSATTRAKKNREDVRRRGSTVPSSASAPSGSKS